MLVDKVTVREANVRLPCAVEHPLHVVAILRCVSLHLPQVLAMQPLCLLICEFATGVTLQCVAHLPIRRVFGNPKVRLESAVDVFDKHAVPVTVSCIDVRLLTAAGIELVNNHFLHAPLLA